MSGGFEVVEWLRPLVETNDWDYAVAWKFGVDPTRFIEWIGCCCGGSNKENMEHAVMPKVEILSEESHLNLICRDTQFPHQVRTKTCEALSKLPLAMSLYSGVHGEVAISQQPKWLIQEDSSGTQVLIPVVGGLIELFTAKLIPKDIDVIEFITENCCVSVKKEAISAQSSTTSLNFNEHFTLAAPGVHLPPVNQCSSNPSTEGPSGKRKRGLSSDRGHSEEDQGKLARETQKEGYSAKNLVTERNRRDKIKKGLYTLRSLVPKITKMDIASILTDAIDYIKELQRQENELKEEVEALEVEDCEKYTTQEQGVTSSLSHTNVDQTSSDCTENTKMEVQAEVHHLGGTDFLIKLYCDHKQGRFSRLMEAMHSFGLHVVNANMTTLNGKVLNILTVEATEQDIHQTELKEYLIQQIGC
ncbi:transcription factor bHLH90 isoform X2 [Lotus japonicus]|uniref:transcription factor bHLH90 isoform X2 n=1 Tax=Lotus japonicus TaxID=34305 RepID=UPI00258FE80F|nr:transcription factor bHLH90 isoform X2 [Lotus japonicus]